MKRKFSLKIVTLVILFCMANIVFADNKLFLWGEIEWSSGTPAAGLEVQLIRNGSVIAINHSNTLGRYGFFNIKGNPSVYEIRILLGNEKLKLIGISKNVAIAGKIPKIIVE